MIDYNLGYVVDAIPKLEVAAEAGDMEAMYYLGESHRITHMGMTSDALEWYLKAAEHNDPYAMLRLWGGGACVAGDECPEDAEGWREKALAEQLPRAEDGDTEAMLALYYIYGALDDSDEGNEWLERAANEGNPEAQHRLSTMIRDGYGFYWSDSRRSDAAIEWARKAAEQDYVPAMNTLFALLSNIGDVKEGWSWLVKASEAGFLDARLNVGSCYFSPGVRGDFCIVEQDKVKGWAIFYAAEHETGSNASQSLLRLNRDDITYEERQEAEELAEDEWLGHGPPLSNFPPKYGF
ncbi:tetratricopeptide repeat protein [Halomonas koreensis]|uniref:Tetratricopeptide repeat protein n=1 Tax=Halomonas koreensis TaxID=245385 RepID=A0ABU1G6Q5_9GAMM|nr:tetratricopeptide repeat protein [Halomonas koreensis]MDR5868203.1 tetratricopeptide repeat protein [Halomonas koreensis]